MADHKFKLIHGLKIGKDTLKEVVMKDHLTAGEILAASEAAEKIVMVNVSGQGEKEAQFIISPTLLSSECLRRQIKSIGDLQGPIGLAELNALHEQDLARLNQAADQIEKLKVSRAVAQRGRSDNDR